MPKIDTRKSKGSRKVEPSNRRQVSSGVPASKTAQKPAPGSTKQDTVLTLLSCEDGVSVSELCAATSWKAHSVRGFLAGTVKKKLGFDLISSRSDDGVRRYRIAPRRGR